VERSSPLHTAFYRRAPSLLNSAQGDGALRQVFKGAAVQLIPGDVTTRL